MKTARRQFLKGTGSVAAGFLGLQRLLESPAFAKQDYQSEIIGYGKLVKDAKRIFDLPEGFSYRVLSSTGDRMTDGLKVPGSPDGMAAFEQEDGRIVLVRNHELDDFTMHAGAYGISNELFPSVDKNKVYDAGKGERPQLGGTTTIVYDPKTGIVEKQFLSLACTARNCAGGPTPWGSWVTCEETVIRPKSEGELKKEKEEKEKKEKEQKKKEKAEKEGKPYEAPKPKKEKPKEPTAKDFYEKWHGYAFEVPATTEIGLADPIPLKDMGRFYHEAVAVDPKSGIVYETEDREDGLFYRFIPKEKGNLKAGGTLQALAVKGKKSCDTRNWPETGKPQLAKGEALDVEWITMDNIENEKDDLRERGHKKGAAIFARGEGIWYAKEEHKIYIAFTSGGIAKSGQIFTYEPSEVEGTDAEKENSGKLTLYLEPNNTQLLQYGDNLTIAPWGDVVLCEDGAEDQYLRGITTDGKIYTIGRNSYAGNSELSGVCFSGETMFLNIQKPGITLAVNGPWDKLVKEAEKEEA